MPERVVTKVLSVQYAMDILMFLHDNGEIKQMKMQSRFSSNNDILAKRLSLLLDSDLATVELRKCDESRHHAKYWKLTQKGERIAELINQMEHVYKGTELLDE